VETIHLQNCMHGSKVRRARSVARRNGPRWTAFAAVNVRVSTVAKADVRGRDVVVVVVVSDIVKRRAVKITLTCFNSFYIFYCCSLSFFAVDGT